MSSILLTIDVEDWFQVENFKPWIPFSSWPSRELRVEKNTHRLLDLFDSVDSKGSETKKSCQSGKSCLPNEMHSSFNRGQKFEGVKATFFVLGWLAERLPNLVREIHARGHEVASHGYNHKLCYQQSPEDLKKDLTDSKKLLEDITGEPVLGFRAPNFSINYDALNIIESCGYLYDSSYNSFAMHGRYGKLNLKGNERSGIAIPLFENQPPSVPASQRSSVSVSSIQKPASRNQRPSIPASQHPSFYELPISNLEFKINNSKFVFPWGGGGYFRLIPFFIFTTGISAILRKTSGYVFYIHPWEIDADQQRVKEAKMAYKFRHYFNLDKTLSKLEKMLLNFASCRFITCTQYLNLQKAVEVL